MRRDGLNFRKHWKVCEVEGHGSGWEVPQTNGKIVLLEKKGNLAFYDSTRDVWRIPEHGIFPMYRMLCHMLDTHAVELPSLQEVIEASRDLQVEFVDLRAVNFKGKYAKEMSGNIYQQLERIGRVVDEYKKQAKTQFALMVFVRDKQGRVNPGVLMCRNVTALDALEKRIGNVRNMQPWIQFYREVIRQVIEQLELVLKDVLTDYTALVRMLADPEQSPRKILIRLSWLEKDAYLLGIKPYQRLQNYLLAEIKSMKQCFEKRDWSGFSKLATIGLNSVKIKQLRKHVELARLDVSLAYVDHRGMPASLRSKIKRRLDAMIHKDLSAVSEKGFKRPVKKKIVSLLSEAYEFLDSDDPNYLKAYGKLDRALVFI